MTQEKQARVSFELPVDLKSGFFFSVQINKCCVKGELRPSLQQEDSQDSMMPKAHHLIWEIQNSCAIACINII